MDEKQSERFKRAARELETDDDEARFNERLKRIARESGRPKDKHGKDREKE